LHFSLFGFPENQQQMGGFLK